MSCNQFSYCPDTALAPSTGNCGYKPTGYAPSGKKDVALNASSGSVGPLPIINTLFAEPINVVSTTIDTRCIGPTNNLLHFSSIVNLPVGISVTLNFQIRRSVDDGASIGVGSTYTFSTTVTVLEGESFSFQFFDQDVQPGFYTYSVQLSTNSLIDVTPGLSINNAVLSVLAVSNRSDCCK
ncbi:MAG: DUF4489 domain-containing protein [Oscillospiraceae bacterium]|mgnify:CR=1 FL=1|jgi:hypothetical protein|nr:DUF4489 domain-containing protein [Oscillospiraceae bacterium]MCI1989732.1 DUF4489 domain-containing protein [Oscillospiraceae bacterium]MCI2034335.1 DUF4489 domain-containing protein [Oscillospiraceae bacterium]